MIIYVITNKLDGKCYVGQTRQSLKRRFQAHIDNVRHDGPIGRQVGAAILELGREHFSIEELAYTTNQDEADQLERYWINKLKAHAPNGYNTYQGGLRGWKHTESTKALLRKPKSAQHRAKLSLAKQGKSLRNSGTFTSERVSGEKNFNAKLTDPQIQEMRLLRLAGWKQKDLAKKFGVRQGYVSKVLLNKNRAIPEEY